MGKADANPLKQQRGPYSTKAQTWLEEENLILLEGWMRDGYTLNDIANIIGISLSTLYAWREKYPEIAKALKRGSEVVDYKVENALLKLALGYRTKETKVIVERNKVTGQVIKTSTETIEKEAAPNVIACQVWLYNRQPNKWKRNRDKLIDIGDEDKSIQISVVRADKGNAASNSPKAESESDDDWEDTDEVNDSVVVTKSAQSTKKAQQQQDLDYWPDDWEDEDE